MDDVRAEHDYCDEGNGCDGSYKCRDYGHLFVDLSFYF